MIKSVRGRSATLALFAACTLPPGTLAAQMTTPRDTTETHNHARLFTAADAALAAGFAGLTVAMFPADKSIAGRLEHDSLAKGFVDHSATAFETLAVPGAYLISPAIYLYGSI